MKRPAFQFYPKDWLSDEHVMLMTLEERGAYIQLLCICWLEGSVPGDLTRMARLCQTDDNRMAELWQSLEPCFRQQGDRWVHPRLDLERKKQDEHRKAKSEAGKKGAKARWDNDENGSATDVPMAKNSSSFAFAFASADKTDTGDKSPERSLDVENWQWGDFAGWMRREGCRKVWGGPEPPDWAHDDKPWTLGRELSSWQQIHNRGEPFEAMVGVIKRNKDPVCGRYYNQAGRLDRYYLAKAEWQKAEAMKGNQLSAILGDMAKKAS